MNGHHETNEVGIYGIRLCKNGEFVEVIIDDFIPVRYDNPTFSKSTGHELWVILLEKAFAKIHGSYLRIEAGLTSNALRDLTGAPSFTKKIGEKDKDLWEDLKNADKKGFLMTASA